MAVIRHVRLSIFVALTLLLQFAHAQVTSVSLNAGSASDTGENVTGTSKKYSVASTTAIAGTTEDVRFTSHRSAVSGSSFTYSFNLQPGTYTVQLGFAEIYSLNCVTGKRVFSVAMNGSPFPGLTNYDPFVSVGCKTADIKTATVTVSSSPLTLAFSSTANNAFVSTVDIAPSSTTTTAAVTTTAATTTTAAVTTTATTTASGSTTAAATTTSPSQSTISIDAGSASDTGANLSGTTKKFAVASTTPIAGTTEDVKFTTHRSAVSGSSFTYSFNVAPGAYTVQLGFAEVYTLNCATGKRVFSVAANGVPVAALTSYDTFADVGCNTASIKSFPVTVTSGPLTLAFTSTANNAFVSTIDISPGGTSTTTAPPSTTTSGTSTSTSAGQLPSVDLDAGSAADTGSNVLGASSKYVTTGSIANTDDDAVFLSHRYGKSFTYSFPLLPGTYNVSLGFAEIFALNCALDKRVFTVDINGQAVPEFAGFDVFKEVGCQTAVVKTVQATVSEVSGPLTIKFLAVTQNAFIASIKITPAADQCVSNSTGGTNNGQDHRAHAVPGEYPPRPNADSPTSYIDSNGDGVETVLVDGTKSHSHYQDLSDPNNPVSGEIVKYKWTDIATNEVLANTATFTKNFPLGTTRLLLEVTDNTCDVATAETTVTVTGSQLVGKTYCYYYTNPQIPDSGGAAADPNKPFFAQERTGFSGALAAPAEVQSAKYSVRCTFFYQASAASAATTISISTASSGTARVFKGNQAVLDSVITPSAQIALAAGLTEFEVVYLRDDVTKPGTLTMQVNGTNMAGSLLSFDRNTVLPVLKAASPNVSSVTGGVKVQVTGYGFYITPDVKFGSVSTKADTADLTPTTFSVTTPAVQAGVTNLTASTPASGTSNALPFTFGNSTADPIKFNRSVVLEQSGQVAPNGLTTCIAVWGDSWYLGTIGGKIIKLTVNANMVVTSRCTTPALVDSEVLSPTGTPAQVDILGIAFSPTDTVGKPYVSSAVLFWFYGDNVDTSNTMVWRNGHIDQFKPSGSCLVFDKHIVSGLPVSDHDHSVNGLDFDQNGNLLASVGGVTNMGLPSASFGNIWETPLSAAMIKVQLSLGASFNGVVQYDQDLPNIKKAKKISGDVSLFATGLRNSFDLCFTSKGEIYATDNGPNSGYGDRPISCEQDDSDLPADNINVTGLVSFRRVDKVVKVTQGAWFGHPNLNRNECMYIDPFTDKDGYGHPPASNYVNELATLTSSINGICEYTASHFGGQFKGEIIISSYAPGGTGVVYRMKPGSKPQNLDSEWSGLSVAQGFWGEIIMPRVAKKDFHVLLPDYPAPAGLSARVVTPYRGGKAGNLVVTITGHNFGTAPTVTIDGKPCPVVAGSVAETSRGSILKCTTPPASAGKELVNVVVSSGGQSSTITDGFMYSLA